jgi:hypothetical protein
MRDLRELAKLVGLGALFALPFFLIPMALFCYVMGAVAKSAPGQDLNVRASK